MFSFAKFSNKYCFLVLFLVTFSTILNIFNTVNHIIELNSSLEKQDSSRTVQTLSTGHTKWINCLILLNNEILASCSADSTIKLWNISSGQEINTLARHTGDVYCLIMLNDAKTLASCSADSTIKLWDITTGLEIKTLTGHEKAVHYLILLNDDSLASCSYDSNIKIWDSTTGCEIKTLKGHDKAIYYLLLLNDGLTLASCSFDRTIKFWDIN
jgi:WD40 repeat protein